MKLFVPVVGSELKLLNETTVALKNAKQNSRFIDKITGVAAPLPGKNVNLTLPKGTLLTVDRVYVRQGAGADFNSLTFKINANSEAGIPKGRFFLSVDVVNTLDVEVVTASPERVMVDNIWALRSMYWDKVPFKERVNNVYLDSLFEDVLSRPSLCDGVLLCNLKNEHEMFTRSLTASLKKVGIDSPSEVVSRIRPLVDEEELDVVEEYVSQINKAYRDINSVMEQDDYEAIYGFSIYQIGCEPVILLNAIERPGLACLKVLDDAYKTLVYHIIKRESEDGRGEHFDGSRCINNHIVEPISKRDTFGRYYYRSNHTPRSLIINASHTKGIIPLESFSENLFTRTRNVGYGHEIIYHTSNGERLKPADLRKLVK